MDHGSECHLVPSACKLAISALIRAHESVLYLHLFLDHIMFHLLQVLGRMPMSVPLNANMLCNCLTGATLLHRFFSAFSLFYSRRLHRLCFFPSTSEKLFKTSQSIIVHLISCLLISLLPLPTYKDKHVNTHTHTDTQEKLIMD